MRWISASSSCRAAGRTSDSRTRETLVSTSDCVHQRQGVRHYLFGGSPDMQYREIVSPADFNTIDTEPVCDVPVSKGWSV